MTLRRLNFEVQPAHPVQQDADTRHNLLSTIARAREGQIKKNLRESACTYELNVGTV